MSYGTIIEGEFFDGSNVLKLLLSDEGSRAVLCLLELRVWSTNAKTDGAIPLHALGKATRHPEPLKAIALLVEYGLAIELSADEWQIEWDAQTTSAEREEQKEGWRIKKRHQRGKHEECPETWWCRKKKSAAPKNVPSDVPPSASLETSLGDSPALPDLTLDDSISHSKEEGQEGSASPPNLTGGGAGARPVRSDPSAQQDITEAHEDDDAEGGPQLPSGITKAEYDKEFGEF
ncbi:hypothetical protein [Rhodococcoides yunnanense]|uniref:hypothetical protein n=1 Tax=Rhodococcoides yunnanense TaxID=278209 RepID=UPI000934B053|nr:hypothetical protein [Rhodococcus yunnanensis]